MKLFFCEKCGKRLTDQDLVSGEALDKQAKGVHCKDCASGVMTMTFEALTDSQAKALTQKAPPPAQTTSATAAVTAPISSSRALPIRAPARDSHPRRPAAKPEALNATPWIAAGAVGLIITLFCALLLAKGSPPHAKPLTGAAVADAKTDRAKAESLPESPWDTNVPAATPLDEPAAPVVPAKAPAQAASPAQAPVPMADPAPEPEAKTAAVPRAVKPKASPIGPDGLLIHLSFDGDVSDHGPLQLEVKSKSTPVFEAGIAG